MGFPRAVAVFVTILLVSQASTVSAQIETVKPEQAQIDLYLKATEAFKVEKYGEAINLLKSSLVFGDLNIVYLNMGRAYFRNGDCVNAEIAYKKALTAPKVESTPPEVIEEKVMAYMADLAECPAIIQVSCTPSDMTISVNGQQPQPCADPLKLNKGDHVITGFSSNKQVQVTISVAAREMKTVNLEIAKEVAPTPVVESGIDGLQLVGYGAIAVGAATMIGALAFDQTVLADDIDAFSKAVEEDSADQDALRKDAEGSQTTVTVLFVTGGVLTAAGVVMALLPTSESAASAENSDDVRVDPWVSHDAAGVNWSLSW